MVGQTFLSVKYVALETVIRWFETLPPLRLAHIDKTGKDMSIHKQAQTSPVLNKYFWNVWSQIFKLLHILVFCQWVSLLTLWIRKTILKMSKLTYDFSCELIVILYLFERAMFIRSQPTTPFRFLCNSCLNIDKWPSPFHACSAQNRLTILVISLQQELFSENIWRKNVNQKLTNNSPTNILSTCV